MPSGPPSSAARGSWRETSGGSEAITALGRYGGLATTRSRLAGSAERREQVAGQEPDARAEPELAHVARGHREGAARESTARTSAAGRACASAQAMAPLPVPRSATTGSGAVGQDLERPLDQPLRLGPRHQHVGGRPRAAGRGTPRTRAGTAAARARPAARPGRGNRGDRRGGELGARVQVEGRSGRRPAARRAATRLPAARSRSRPPPARRPPRASSAGTVRSAATPDHGTLSASFWLTSQLPQRVDQLVEIALEHGGQPVQGEVDPVIGDPALGKVVGADPLAALAGADLAPPVRRDGGGLLLLRPLEQPGLEHAQGLRPVLDLRALVLAGHDQAGGQVREPHRRVGGVDALAARAGGAVDVDPHVLLVHLDVDVLGLRQHRHRHRRGVDAPARLGGGHALHAVHAALELEPAPRAAALDERRSPP